MDLNIEKLLAQSNRRLMLCANAPICPKCKTRQVQIVGYNLMAKWKCRYCRHKFIHEPLVKFL